MNRLKPSYRRFLPLVGFLAALASGRAEEPARVYDVVVYGGSSAGIAAAVQVSRQGGSVVVIEPGRRIGGLTTGGLGQTDIGNKQVIGGIAREFYERVKKHYDTPENWKWQSRESYRDGGQTRTDTAESAMWTFEPSAALVIMEGLVREHGFPEGQRDAPHGRRCGAGDQARRDRGIAATRHVDHASGTGGGDHAAGLRRPARRTAGAMTACRPSGPRPSARSNGRGVSR